MNTLETLKQNEVFKHFLELTKIPRESGNERTVSDYCVNFAKTLGLEVIQEPSMNVIIKKPGSKGMEKAPTLILQGHLDMVCVKKDDLEFDFTKDAIPLLVDGDILKTEGTTLGADNGIAVAMIMAILESKSLSHPPIEALFTVEEETGMGGVMSLMPENLTGQRLINIDAEEEGVILASCAGGVNNILTWPLKWVDGVEGEAFKLTVSGLKGGHSGIEINRMRANAIKLIGRALRAILRDHKICISEISGGEKMNAIAKYAQSTLLVPKADVEALEASVKALNKQFIGEHLGSDPDIKLALEKTSMPNKVLDQKTMLEILDALCLMPFGVQTMSSTIEGLVESSSNLGILTFEADKVTLTNSVRSSIVSLKKEISLRATQIAELTHAEHHQISDYPAWAYRKDSELRDTMIATYEALYQKKLKVDAIHAGLECGFLSEKLGDIDMIAMGPNMRDVHTPYEAVSISSVQNVYEFLCHVLSKLA